MYLSFGREVDLKAKYSNTMGVAFLWAVRDRNFKDFFDIYKTIPSEYRKPVFSSVGVKCFPRAVKFAFDRLAVGNKIK